MNGRTAPWAYFDIFTTDAADKAADAQKAGLNAGYNLASTNIGQGIDALKTNYTAALQPFMTNFNNATAGTTALGNALGLNGQAGNDAARAAFMNNPGYQFQLEQGNNAINAQAAATGMNASGNQLIDLAKFNQGLAGTSWNNYVGALQPYLGASNAAAGGIANVNTGLGNQLAGQYDSLANLGWQKETGIGNANANADLAANNASANIWNMIGKLGGSAASAAGSMMMLSDERLKEDIEQVGELYDGQPVYKYRYIDSPMFQIGLMAQDVEQTYPDAVGEIAGFKAVDYDKATDYAAGLARFLEAA